MAYYRRSLEQCVCVSMQMLFVVYDLIKYVSLPPPESNRRNNVKTTIGTCRPGIYEKFFCRVLQTLFERGKKREKRDRFAREYGEPRNRRDVILNFYRKNVPGRVRSLHISVQGPVTDGRMFFVSKRQTCRVTRALRKRTGWGGPQKRQKIHGRRAAATKRRRARTPENSATNAQTLAHSNETGTRLTQHVPKHNHARGGGGVLRSPRRH